MKNGLTHVEENPGPTPSKLLERYKTLQTIYNDIESDPKTKEITLGTTLEIIEAIKSRCHPGQEQVLEKNLTGIDLYCIPEDLEKYSDEELIEILKGLLCRPQHLGKDYFLRNENSQEWIITNAGLSRLNYILSQAMTHTIRQIEEATILHHKKNKSTTKRTPRVWDPEDNNSQHQKSLTKPGFWYFKRYFKDGFQLKDNEDDQETTISFQINSIKDYLAFVRSLLSSKEIKNKYGYIDQKPNKKSFARRQKDGLFLKNIIAFSDMERDDRYTQKRTHFPQIIREIFLPFFQICDDNTGVNTRELDNHEFEFSTNFLVKAYGKKLKGKFILNTKAQTAILDKVRREPNYSTSSDLKDLIRGSIIMDNQDDLILMMHYSAKYFIKNPKGKFDHSIFNSTKHERGAEMDGFDPARGLLRGLEIHDKGILIPNEESEDNPTRINNLPKGTQQSYGKTPYELTNDELNRAATLFLARTNKHKDKKSTTSNMYVDTKYIIPIIMRANLSSIELQFITKEDSKKNNQGINDHRIMRLKQDIQLRCRDQKYIDEYKIRIEINKLLDDKKLKREIWQYIAAQGNKRKSPEDFLYEDITKGLIPIKYKESPDGEIIPIYFCNKKIYRNLLSSGYFPIRLQVKRLLEIEKLRNEVQKLIKTSGKEQKTTKKEQEINGNTEEHLENFLYKIFVNQEFRKKIQKYLESNGNTQEFIYEIITNLNNPTNKTT